MKLKEHHPRTLTSLLFRLGVRLPMSLRWFLGGAFGLALLGVIILASIYQGMVLQKTGEASNLKGILSQLSQSRLGTVANYLNGLSAQTEHLRFDIKFRDFQKLAFDREVALENHILLTSTDDFVPVRIRYGDTTLKAKMRLKGDLTHDNLQGEKWSYRVKLSGNNTLFGMKQFSLHHPRVRNYIYEWIFHQALQKEDIPSLRYSFVRVSINGKDLGIYALEEHFEKRLVEHTRNREGPIVKFNENLRWTDVRQHWPRDAGTGLRWPHAADVDVFKLKTTISDSSLFEQFIMAQNLLEQFREGTLSTSDVFDVPKMARYYAMTDLMGGLHALAWHNLRFYYNPITSLLEPVGFDANAGERTTQIVGSYDELNGPVRRLMLSDDSFFREYVACLERFSQKEYLDRLLSELEDQLQANLAIIHSEYPYFYYSSDVLYQNQHLIRETLQPIKGLHAYCDQVRDQRLDITVGAIGSLPVEVVSLSCGDTCFALSNGETVCHPTPVSEPVVYSNINFEIPDDFDWDDSLVSTLSLNYRVLGASQMRTASVFPWKRINTDLVDQDIMRQESNTDRCHFLEVDEATQTIVVKLGHWEMSENLIIPAGYRVLCPAGVVVDLTNSAKIISFSPLHLTGSEDSPIIIRSRDSLGQGLAVINAADESILDHVIFTGLANPSQGGWSLTGAVTFYESPVRITNCRFERNRSEDCLNIVRSQFSIERSVFIETFSDAFDGDFVNGEMTDVRFVNCGNDAFDISGSEMSLTDVTILGAGDKGLSVGENSRLTAIRIEISGAEIGIACKDLSSAKLVDIVLDSCQVGFALFQKKPEYGAANVTVDGLTLIDIDVPYLVEEQSTLLVDNEVVTSDQDNVRDVLYGVVYGKASR